MKIKKKYLILMIITLIVSVGTLTYAYFEGTILNDGVNKTTVTTGSINVNISDTSVVATDVKPLSTDSDDSANQFSYEQASFVKKFTVSNDADSLNVCVGLYLKINSVDSQLVSQYFRYKIVQDDTGTSIEGNFSDISTLDDKFLGSLYFFNSGESKSYTMYIWIEYDTNANQTDMLNKTMNATLYVKAVDCKLKENCDTRTTYSINYKLNGGSGCYKTSLKKNSSIGSVCEPYKEGYKFVGWYSDASLSTVADTSSTRVMDNDITFYAKWEKEESGSDVEELPAPTVVCEKYKPIESVESYKYRVILTNNFNPTYALNNIDYCVNNTGSVDDCSWASATLIAADSGLTVAFSLTSYVNPYAYGWVRVGKTVSKVGSGECPRPSSGGGSSGGTSTTIPAPTLTCSIYKPISTAENYIYKIIVNANNHIAYNLANAKYCVNNKNSYNSCKWQTYSTSIKAENSSGYELPASTRNYYGWLMIDNVVSKVGTVTCPVDNVSGSGGGGQVTS
mgnify:CR=1 FL=1